MSDSVLPRDPELELHHQMQFRVLPTTLIHLRPLNKWYFCYVGLLVLCTLGYNQGWTERPRKPVTRLLSRLLIVAQEKKLNIHSKIFSQRCWHSFLIDIKRDINFWLCERRFLKAFFDWCRLLVADEVYMRWAEPTRKGLRSSSTAVLAVLPLWSSFSDS